KQGNVQKFNDINTSIGQTNEALTQKAEKAELTKTNDGLSQLETKTNEIKTTADGTKQTLTELKTKVDNTKIDVRNILLNSQLPAIYSNNAPIYPIDVSEQTEGTVKFLRVKNSKKGTDTITLSLYNGFLLSNVSDNIAGRQVTFSHKVRASKAMSMTLMAMLYGSSEFPFPDRNKTFEVNGSWATISTTLTMPNDLSKYTGIRFILSTPKVQQADIHVDFREWKIEFGNQPTDWTPAPEDQVTTTDFTKKTVEIETTIKGINTSVSNIQNEQGKLTERVTKSEQTADGFKTSIESLTKKDGEISNKLNTVESTVEGTKKTISDIQSDTTLLKQTTTEIKEQAGKISEKLTSVEKNFNEQEIGVRNLISDTKYWETTQISSNSAYGVFKNNLNQIFSELAGETVTFSFDVKITTTDKTAGRVQFYGENGSPKYTFVRQIFTGITDEFQRVTYTTKITEQTNNAGQARLEFWGIDAKTTKIIIRNFKLEKGNKATGWTPAPEDQVTTDEFTKKTTEIEKSVDGVKTTVSTVQKDQGTMQTTLNQVKQTTDSNSQTITTLSQTQGKQGEVIQQNKSDITQLNNQIKSKVTDTQMQEYVGGLGSTNLLFNAAFEDRVINATTGVVTSRKPSISKWSVGPNGSNFTAVPETARNHDGMNSVKLESSGQTVDRNAAFYQSLPVSPNSGDYVLSAWFYTDAVATIDNTAFVMIEFYNGSTWVTNKVIQLVPLLTNGSWKFVSVTMPAPASGVTTIRFVVVIRKNGRLWVSQPQLQQGITPSSFMENPKDYANYDQLVGEIAKKVATADFDSKVSKMETTINQQSNRIDFKAETENVYSKTDADGRFGSKAMVERHESSITLMSNQINSTV
ncbi:peptidase S74, partial [Bacillus cereus]|nr:peptidase S74 [Bacillus cereus]